MTAVLSIAVFAVPTALIGWGFEPVGEKFIERRREKKRREKAPMVRVSDRVSNASSGEFGLKIFSGSEDKEEGSELGGLHVCPTCKRALPM